MHDQQRGDTEPSGICFGASFASQHTSRGHHALMDATASRRASDVDSWFAFETTDEVREYLQGDLSLFEMDVHASR
jgi:hypothetical protein